MTFQVGDVVEFLVDTHSFYNHRELKIVKLIPCGKRARLAVTGGNVQIPAILNVPISAIGKKHTTKINYLWSGK